MMYATMSDIAGTRAFFGPRAAGWEDRYPDDGPQFHRAITELAPPKGGRAADIGCGTGRALSDLRAAVGADGSILGIDVTPEMLAEARRRGRGEFATLILADATKLPLADGSLDAVFTSGLVSHLPDPVAGLAELARVTARNGRLALFHPLGRIALATKQGRVVSADDVRAPDTMKRLLTQAGWWCESVDDAPERYLALAVRAH